jgi:FkbM family methyltransferase
MLKLLVKIIRIIFNFFENKKIRKAIFDTSKPNTILFSRGVNEKFILQSNDQVIGRTVYATKKPFDFDKLTKVLKILNLKKAELLIDVGANIGTICIPAIKRKLFNKAIVFEPEPLNYSLLLSNTIINGCYNKIITHNIALGSKNREKLNLQLDDYNKGNHRIIINSKIYSKKNIVINSYKLDSFIKNINSLSTVVWIDVQGYETQVLLGAKKLLNKKTPVCIEFSPTFLEKKKYNIFKKIFIKNGYNYFYNLNLPLKKIALNNKSIDILYKTLKKNKFAETDLLFVYKK